MNEEGIEAYLPEARELAAQCWCDPETGHAVMDVALAEAVARRIAVWMQTAAMFSRNETFARNLLDRCAKHLGPAAYTSDDGSVSDSPLLIKIPELVGRLCTR